MHFSLVLHSPHDPFITERQFHDSYKGKTVKLPPSYMSVPSFRHGNGGIRDEGLYRRPLVQSEMLSTLKDYYAMISAFDFHLGRVFQKLKDDHLWNRTIIVFTSDQGLAVGGRHGMNGKSTLYEEYKSPLVIYGPGIKKGSSSELVYLFDIYPTLCDLAAIPKPWWLRGSSLVRFFRTPEQIPTGALIAGADAAALPPWRKHLFCYFAANQGLLARMVRDEEWKLIWYPNLERFSLFNLKQDPHELQEITNETKTHRDTMHRMKTIMIEQQVYWNDTFLASTPNTFVPFPLMQREIEALQREKQRLQKTTAVGKQPKAPPVTLSHRGPTAGVGPTKNKIDKTHAHGNVPGK